MEFPKHYSLHSENDKHFVIHDGRDGSKFNIAKKDIHPAHQIKIMKMKKMYSGGESGDGGEDGPEEGVVPASLSTEAPEQAPQEGVDLSVPTSVTPSQEPADNMPDANPDNPQMQAAPQPNQQQGPSYPTSDQLNSAIGANVAGVQQEASAQEKQNTAMAAQYQKNLEEQQRYGDMQNAKLAEYQSKYDDMAGQVAAGKIDPEHYMHSKGTGGKIGTAISLILGGIGAGLTHGPNQALQLLQKHIDNDIEAQKENLGNKRSLLSENLRAQGNLVSATNATRLQMSAMAQGQLMKVAAQTNNPIIAARAQQHAAGIIQSTIPARMQLANNEIQMHIRGDVLNRLRGQGQQGVPDVDMQDLARAGLVDKATAEKEGAAISKRQQAEAYLMDNVKKLDQEQTVWGKGNIVPNIANPGSYARRDQLRAGVIQAIQSASPSKRLNPEMLAIEAEPFLTKTLDSDKTREEGLNGLIGLIRSHADPTPIAAHYRLKGAINQGNTTRKSFDLGPVK